uniref:G-protein coupled receptors family 1 profile domain-containing protein n=1 Tax=Microcebus murinus TaxID=30608 RepID=A0A8C5XZB8_MICMU
MVQRNHSGRVSEFVLLGFPASAPLRALLFALSLLAYMLVLTENIPSLQQSGTIPPSTNLYASGLLGLNRAWTAISFEGCMTQLYFFLALGCTECALLAVMAYDRYVAICHPLHYLVIISSRSCVQMAFGSWAGGFGISMVKVFFISRLSYCGPNIINHFFCDVSPLLNLSCTDMSTAELADLSRPFHSVGPFSVIGLLHGHYRCCDPFTCASHLTGLIIFYAAISYLCPAKHSQEPYAVLCTCTRPGANPRKASRD